MPDGTLNTYNFASIRSLRALLSNFTTLERMAEGGDTTSAAILLDVRKALSDDEDSPSIVTPRQRKAIELHLIRDIPAEQVARKLGVGKRTVYFIVRAGLANVLAHLQDKRIPSRWGKHEEALLRNPNLSCSEIALRLGKSTNAVQCALRRIRKREHIPTRKRSRRTSR